LIFSHEAIISLILFIVNVFSSISLLALNNETPVLEFFKAQLAVNFLFIEVILFDSLSLLFSINLDDKSSIC